MKTEKIYDAIGEIDDTLVVSAKRSSPRKKLQKRMVAATLIFIFAVTAFLGINKIAPNPVQQPTHDTEPTEASSSETDAADAGEETSAQLPEYIKPTGNYLSYALISGEYPQFKDQYSWKKEKTAYGFNQSYINGVPFDFYKKLICELLNGDSAENKVISPFSVFLSLSILSELSGGESRSQILDVLGFSSQEALRENAASTWLDVYENGNVFLDTPQKVICIPSNSIWLNDNVRVNTNSDVNEILQRKYYSSLFCGDPANTDYQSAYRAWLNEHTGDKLKDSVNDFALSSNALMTVVSTLHLDTPWTIPFDEQLTASGTFYGTRQTKTAAFMNTSNYVPSNCYEAPTFLAVCKSAQDAGNMWFILPNEGTSISELLDSGAFMDICFYEAEDAKNRFEENWEYKNRFTPQEDEYDLYAVKSSIPVFDVYSDGELTENLTKMGLKDIFDQKKATFSYFENGSQNVYVTGVKQTVRYSIDENGISAAAIIRSDFGFGDPKFKYIDFTLNKPFLFLFTKSGVPLFAGIIHAISE